jgi:peptide/nickel transport system substrate-binding protein
MKLKHQFILISAVLLTFLLLSACPKRQSADAITMSLSEKFSGIDTLTNAGTDAAADRIRNLLFNSLVKKNDNFEYVGDLAKEIKIGDDGLTVTFNLHENVKFHNGKIFSSADAKYTLDALFAAEKSAKAASFFETGADGKGKIAHIEKIETPDAKTLVIKVTRPALVNQLLSNLVTIPIIPEGTIELQKTAPIGTGAFKLVNFDQVNSFVQFEAFAEHWEGAPKIQKLNVKTVTDANALQAELQSGNVDIAPIPNNLSPDSINNLGQMPNLKVEKFEGSNIDYIGFNTDSTAVKDVKIRQAIAYSINREEIIRTLLRDQARIAHSIIPPESWAYSEGTKYEFNPEKAKQLIKEAGYKGEVIKFKFAANNMAVSFYTQAIQESLKGVGLNVEIETLIPDVLRETLKTGQFQMNTGRWIGGNQDPIFYKDLFASTEFPDKKDGGRNRARYSNTEFDKTVNEAIDITSKDKTKAKELYTKAQTMVSQDLPLFPLWYPANIVISSNKVSNIKINASGDWSFVRTVTVNN